MILNSFDFEMLFFICAPLLPILVIILFVWSRLSRRYPSAMSRMSIIVLCMVLFLYVNDQVSVRHKRLLVYQMGNTDNAGALYAVDRLRENGWLHDHTLWGADLSHADLSNIDLSDTDLYMVNFSYAILSGANLSGAELAYTDFSYADAENADFRGAVLTCTDFTYAKLHASDFSSTFVPQLRRLNPTPSTVYATSPFNCGAIFARSDLTNAKFNNAELQWSNFEGADLTGADLTGANLSEAHFAPADIMGAIFRDVIWDEDK